MKKTESEAYQDFLKYHEQNPHMYEAFKKYTLAAIGKGYKNFSAEFVYNVIRWETGFVGNDEFKINNNYRSWYSRLFMQEHPEYNNFFRTRKALGDGIQLAS